jgi:hypothetical protein
MANTKNLKGAARKNAKRQLRKKYKATYMELSLKDRKKLRKYEGGGGLRQFLVSLEKEKQEAATKAEPKKEAEKSE